MKYRVVSPVEIPDIEVVGNRVMILQFPVEEVQTESGIIIKAETSKQLPWLGVVVAVGPGETAANLAREAIAAIQKEVKIADEVILTQAKHGTLDVQKLAGGVENAAREALEAAREITRVVAYAAGFRMPMQVQPGDIVMFQGGIWANALGVALGPDGHETEYLLVREDYIAGIRHKAGTPEAIRKAAKLGVVFETSPD
jgi:co-chaperonin GroES (HSP10)